MTIRAVRYVNGKPVVSHTGFLTDMIMEIQCFFPECPAVYRIDYSSTEIHIDVGKLRRDATGKVNRSHPEHPDVIVIKH